MLLQWISNAAHCVFIWSSCSHYCQKPIFIVYYVVIGIYIDLIHFNLIHYEYDYRLESGNDIIWHIKRMRTSLKYYHIVVQAILPIIYMSQLYQINRIYRNIFKQRLIHFRKIDNYTCIP